MIFTNFTSIHSAGIISIWYIHYKCQEDPLYKTDNDFMMDSFWMLLAMHSIITSISTIQYFVLSSNSLIHRTLDLGIIFFYFGSIFKCQINFVNDKSLISEWILTELITFYTQILVAILMLICGIGGT